MTPARAVTPARAAPSPGGRESTSNLTFGDRSSNCQMGRNDTPRTNARYSTPREPRSPIRAESAPSHLPHPTSSSEQRSSREPRRAPPEQRARPRPSVPLPPLREQREPRRGLPLLPPRK